MRFGNAVGKPAFKNTNRKDPNYTRKKNRLARIIGFRNHEAKVAFDRALGNILNEQEI